jgi:hypothetical protein
MAGYVLVRSNWTSINSISLDLVCDIDIEEKSQSTIMDKQEENNDDVNLRLVLSVILIINRISCVIFS